MPKINKLYAIALTFLVGGFVPAASSQAMSPSELAVIASELSVTSGAVVGAPPQTAPAPLAPPAVSSPTSELVEPKIQTRELFPGAEPLSPFGYEVFARSAIDLAGSTSLPAPIDYVLAAGDTLEVLVIAERGGRFPLTVSRDGEINIPQIGPIVVSGQRFTDAKKVIEDRISTQISGARANVTLAAMRSIQIFVLGEAVDPGPRAVPALSTISSALMASGGIKPIGSLRNVKLRRGGAIVARLDLYDLLVRGDASNDQRLLSGDVIFIPPVGALVGVAGAVKRPGIYELKPGGGRINDLIELAGGLDVNADQTQAVLNRVGLGAKRESVAVNLTDRGAVGGSVRDGDFLTVASNLPVIEGQVELLGHLHRPGKRAVGENTRISDLLASFDELKPNSDLGYVFIARVDRVTGEPVALSADLRAAWKDPNSAANVRLVSGDRLVAFEADRPRDQIVQCVLRPAAFNRVRQSRSPPGKGSEPKQGAESEVDIEQSNGDTISACFEALSSPAAESSGAFVDSVSYPTVNVSGSLRAPGIYPYESGMRVSDLVRAGGGISDRAFTLKAELIRYVIGPDQIRRREVLMVDLQRALAGDETADTVVLPYDEFAVRTIPEWSARGTVTLEGEVMFPGTYAIAPGETLRGVLERAGGLKTTAFVQGAFFSRESLRQRELEQLRKLQSDLRRDVAAQQRALLASERSGDAGQLTALLSESLEVVEENPGLGRLSIDLDKVMRGNLYSRDDLLLKDGDRLLVPQRSDEVSVIGEVFAQSSHLYQRGLTVADYLAFAGGLRNTANENGIYVMSASGRARPVSNGWLPGSSSQPVRPGDTIIVPVQIPKLRDPLLATVGEVTQILYNLSLGAAAIRSFRN